MVAMNRDATGLALQKSEPHPAYPISQRSDTICGIWRPVRCSRCLGPNSPTLPAPSLRDQSRNELWKRQRVYHSTELKGSFKAAARRKGTTEAYLIREAVAKYVAAEPRPLPSVFGSVEDGTISAANYEDWLAENWKPDW